MRTKSWLVAAVCAIAIAGPSAGAAFAGEVTGPPGSVDNPGTPKDISHANSICVFSGLNDFVNGPTDFIVQSYGQDVRLHGADPTDKTQAFPGNSCQGGSNPYHV
jgi:hypothetical protein